MAKRQTRSRNQTPKLSVVIPCYNEEDGIAELHRRVSAVCKKVVGQSYEIVLVNDGSRDATGARLFDLSLKDSHVVAVDLARNYGQQIALSAGLDNCMGERILILDADLQDPPELLPDLMAKMDEGHDVVYGQRIRRDGETWLKKKTSKVFYRLLSRLTDIDIPKDTGDFRLMNRKALDCLRMMNERVRYMRGMISWIGLRQAALPYMRQQRFAGNTHWPFHRLVSLAIDALTGFSVAPLRFASLMGFTFAIMAFLALFYTLASWILNYAVPGWTSLASIMLLVSSVQLFVLGIIGEYLGRTYMETKRRPLYFVQEISRTRNKPTA